PAGTFEAPEVLPHAGAKDIHFEGWVKLGGENATDLGFSPGGKYLFVADGGELFAVELADPARRRLLVTNRDAVQSVVCADDALSLCAVGSNDGRSLLIDWVTPTGRTSQTLPEPGNPS